MHNLSWSTKRKLIYISIIFGILFLTIILPLFFHFSVDPTCSDNKKNQDEKGIDCGGICQKICSFEISKPIVLWSRSFKVAPHVYNSLALVENYNLNSKSDSISYRFRLRDNQGNIIAEREGKTSIPNSRVSTIFETGIRIDSDISLTDFEFLDTGVWIRDTVPSPDITIRNQILSNVTTSPRLQIEIENKSLKNIKKLEIVAIILDGNGNAIGSSRTFVDDFYLDKIANLVFTWNTPFTADICESNSGEVCNFDPTTVEIVTKVVQE